MTRESQASIQMEALKRDKYELDTKMEVVKGKANVDMEATEKYYVARFHNRSV